jgi:hypothetical protein
LKLWRAVGGLLLAGLPVAVQASTSLRFCGSNASLSVAEQDRLLQVAALLRDELEAQGQPAALLSRAGTKLQRFGIRYTHAALSLQANPLAPWGVRQLYFACDERRSRLFDQGIAGFLMGADDAEQGFVSLLLLPAEAAQPLADAALDADKAQHLLAGDYIANAHPRDLLRQNCNQWLAELLALAWGPPGDSGRAAAQATLASWSYAPEPVRYGNALWRWAAAFVPWISFDGHPPEDAEAHQVVTSLPPDLEALALQRWPAARRIELCYTPERVVLRRAGARLSDACEAGEGDLLRQF